jgi:hypothetical protein
MKRLILVISAILLFGLTSWAAPVASASGARTQARAAHRARLVQVSRKNRHRRTHYKRHRRRHARRHSA